METSTEVGKIAGALAKAQGRLRAVEKDRSVSVETRDGDTYDFEYATFGACMDAARAPLAENGIAVVQGAAYADGRVLVTTLLVHESGEWLREVIQMPVAGRLKDGKEQAPGPQAVGSAITYGRRYGFCALVGLVSEEDEDGNAAEGNRAKVREIPKCPTCAKPVRLSKDNDGSYYCWAKKGGCGWSGFLEPAAPAPDAPPETTEQKVARARAAAAGVQKPAVSTEAQTVKGLAYEEGLGACETLEELEAFNVGFDFTGLEPAFRVKLRNLFDGKVKMLRKRAGQ
jgi:ERF superfamily protein